MGNVFVWGAAYMGYSNNGLVDAVKKSKNNVMQLVLTDIKAPSFTNRNLTVSVTVPDTADVYKICKKSRRLRAGIRNALRRTKSRSGRSTNRDKMTGMKSVMVSTTNRVLKDDSILDVSIENSLQFAKSSAKSGKHPVISCPKSLQI